MDKQYLMVLAREFSAEEGSFLLQLRMYGHWDKEAFLRLTEAMRACCKDYQYSQAQIEREINDYKQLENEQSIDEFYRRKNEHDTMLPRWLADGFWYLTTFVRSHTSRPAWKQTIAQESEYFSKAYERLEFLALWFFSGYMPWTDEEKGWASTFVQDDLHKSEM